MKEIIYLGQDIKLCTYLANKFSLSFSLFCKYLKTNKIKVNNKKVSPNYKLVNNDIIKIYLEQFNEDNPLAYARQNIDIVYEDDNILIVNKPQALPTIDEDDVISDTLINRALVYLKYEPTQSFKPCLCHRLDTNTSGIVLIAKNQTTQNILEKIIKDHTLLKEYTAITAALPKESGTIKSYLLKEGSFVKNYTTKIPSSKEAILEYKRIAINKNFSLCKIILKTGRTHQIRVQFASIDAPILGDTKYGNITVNTATNHKRQLLIASRIVFPSLNNSLSYLSNKEFSISTKNLEKIFNEL